MSMIAARASRHTSGYARFIPILSWLPRYERAWLGIDVKEIQARGIRVYLADVHAPVAEFARRA